MIGIINYGVGNIKAIANVYHRLDIPFKIIQEVDDFEGVNRLILPGVGAFDYAMELLHQRQLKPILDEYVLHRRMPVLGICVGMQIMMDRSDEGQLPGLGWIEGDVKQFDISLIHTRTKLPHMGWNDVEAPLESPLFEGLHPALFYFLHSYYVSCAHEEQVLARSEYGARFCCAIHRDNIYGVQFHPEKSLNYGVKLLKNFAKL